MSKTTSSDTGINLSPNTNYMPVPVFPGAGARARLYEQVALEAAAGRKTLVLTALLYVHQTESYLGSKVRTQVLRTMSDAVREDVDVVIVSARLAAARMAVPGDSLQVMPYEALVMDEADVLRKKPLTALVHKAATLYHVVDTAPPGINVADDVKAMNDLLAPGAFAKMKTETFAAMIAPITRKIADDKPRM